MDCKDRRGNIISEGQGQDKVLKILYGTSLGRQAVKILIRPAVSRAAGWLMDRKISKAAIKPFVKANNIVLSDYEKDCFRSYNEFFTRKIKSDKRPVDMEPDHFISPCDSKLTVYKIEANSRFMIKNTEYSIESLTRSCELSQCYAGGYLMLFRLAVADYHRYCYVDNGEKSENHIINGVFHTVNPIANDEFPIYKENTRCMSFLKSENFGTLMMMEVGALMVGKIVNYHGAKEVKRGEEKGRFEFGGSTVIICVKEGTVDIDKDIIYNTAKGFETKVKYGEKIGVRIKKD